MKNARLGLLIVCCLSAALPVLPTAAAGDPSESSQTGPSTQALSGSLVILGVPGEEEQKQAAEDAQRATPESFAARQDSQTAYENLDAEQAKQLAASAFPNLITQPAGGPPTLPEDEKITNYLSDYTAQVALPEHRHAVIESVDPIAVQESADHPEPIDLHLTEREEGFEPINSAVSVKIPHYVSAGVDLGSTGVSLTPVRPDGSPMSAPEGQIDGTTVLYPNALNDADTLVKPTTLGFSIETLLRSEESPRTLSFRIGMPSGASLRQASDGSPGLEVIFAGETIAQIPSPTAIDAEGAQVPVFMTASGDMIALALPESLSQYRLPIAVDPSVTDNLWQNETRYGTFYRSGWYFSHNGPYFTATEHPEGGKWEEHISENHTASEYGGLFYTTQGASQIVSASAEGEWNDTNAQVQNFMRLTVPTAPYIEAYSGLPVATEPGHPISGTVCSPASHCPGTTVGPAPAENGNTAGYYQESTGLSNWTVNPTNKLTKASVSITQEQGPTIKFDTADPTIHNPASGENIPNVLYGSGSWLGPHSGAFEVQAEDLGLGLKMYRTVMSGGWLDWKEYYGEGACIGVKCPQHDGPYPGYYQGYTYSSQMHDGEMEAEAFTEDMVGLQVWVNPLQKIKVDGTPPREITVSGFQNGSELPLGETTLKVTAKDGSGTTKSSGLKSIKISIDGKEVSGTAASCPVGPCSATTEATLAARNYPNGEHSLVVSALDNANNLAQEEFNFWVHGASPVSVGPGSVDPSTGQLTLSATDVTPGGGIGLSRTYESRELAAGAEGPVGSQWALDLGGDERLTTLVGGDAILSATSGGDTTFLSKGKGEFESPPGDGNLKLEGKEAVPGKGITEYLLKNEKAGTKTKFERPSGLQSTTPTFEGQFGEAPSQLSHPVGVAVDPTGNLWTTNAQSDLIEKYSPTGTLLAAYGSYGSGEKQFSLPWGIAVDPRNGNVYVSDQGNFRIQELSSAGAFVKTFGWGVKDGQAQLESCTEKCRSGIAGANNGQFSYLAGLAVDASGNLWVADYGNNRIQEFNEKAEFVRKFGSVGSGESQLKEPLAIALSGGNLYISDYGNNRVQEFSSTGSPVTRFGECSSGPGAFTHPYGIATDPSSGNLYIVDQGHSRVQECSAAHAFITKFGSTGSGPGQFTSAAGAAVGVSGEIYALDYNTNRIEQWTRPTWIPTEAGGPLSEAGGGQSASTTFAYTTVEREGKPQIEPTEALSPVPVGVSCGTKASELKRGCRALTFAYAEHKTATGENESEWGDFEGDLSRVYFHVWDSSKGEMIETAVAQYSYDNKGRLRAEWDPRITPSLKTIYGYDYEGHLTSVAEPGQEPWTFTYGPIVGDPSSGRLLKLTRPGATTSLWGGNLPANEEAPKVTGSFVVGVTLGVSTGKWSNSPVSYGYQWEDCNSGGGECVPIPGATNATYTLTGSDVGHVVEAVVTATNAGGSRLGGTVGGHVVTTTGTKVEGEHRAPEPGTTIEYGVPASGSKAPYALGAAEAKAWGQENDLPVEGVAIFPPDEPMGWPAGTYKRATVNYFDKNGRMVNTALPTGGIATTEYNATNDVARTLSADNRATALAETGKTTEVSKLLDTKSEYNSLGDELLQTRGPQHAVKLANGTTVQAREHARYFYDEGAPGGQSFGLVTKKTDGAEYEGKEGDVRTSLTAYSGQEGLGWTLRKPTATILDPAGLDLVTKTIYDKVTGNVLETRSPGGNSETIYPPAYASIFGSEGSGNGQLNEPRGVAIDASGSLWVADQNNSRVDVRSSTGAWVSYGTKGTGNLQFEKPWGIAINQSTGNVYVADRGNNRIEELSSSGTWVANFGTSGEGTLKEPTGVALDVSGNLYVSDKANNRVIEFGPTGTFIRAFGTLGSGNGQLNAPLGIAISEGSVYVVDSANSRVEQFSATGTYIGQFGSNGAGAGQFKEAVGIAANPSTGGPLCRRPLQLPDLGVQPSRAPLDRMGHVGPQTRKLLAKQRRRRRQRHAL